MNEAAYVCAFRGRRDNYQVPHALAESARLQSFITDAYASPVLRKLENILPRQARSAVRFRHLPELPDSRVTCLWGSTLLEHVRHRMGYSPVLTWSKLDQVFSRAAEKEARRTGSHLFLYSPYAWEAFRAQYKHTPRRVLFEYHAHPSTETPLLSADMAKYPEVRHSYTEATGRELPAELRHRTSDVWRMADSIVCASSFTRDTLVTAGADPSLITVIPYGVEGCFPSPVEAITLRGAFKAIFVGSGVQRKGLHHLLRAWKIARLGTESSLTIVSRNLDPGLEDIVASSPRTRLIRGVPAAELYQLYRESTLFVMPSLIEGFGQVYLEALSLGCPVLGTKNTCLPDVGGEEDGVFLTEPGDWEKLAARLEELANQDIFDANIRLRAQLCAQRFTWQRFRNQLQTVL